MPQRTRGPVPDGELVPAAPEAVPDGEPVPAAPEAEPPGEWVTIDGVAYRRVVLCFLLRSPDQGSGGGNAREVLLGLKRTGFGTGRVVALGGKIDGHESAADAAVREVAEESGIALMEEDLRDAGRIRWSFPARPGWNMAAFLFTASAGTATAVASDEIEPHWYPVDDVPWDGMWQDAPHWTPAVLDGRRVDARIVMAADNEAVATAVVL